MTDRAWFSRLVQQSARKWSGSLFITLEPARGQCTVHFVRKYLGVVVSINIKGNGKVNHAPQEGARGCSSTSSRPWARRWRTTNVGDAWPVRRQTMVTFSDARHHRPLAGAKLYCLVTEAQLAQGCTQQRDGWDSNPRPTDRMCGTLSLHPRGHTLLILPCFKCILLTSIENFYSVK